MHFDRLLDERIFTLYESGQHISTEQNSFEFTYGLDRIKITYPERSSAAW